MTCICSPAGTDEFFLEVGVPVATRTTPPPSLEGAGLGISETDQRDYAEVPHPTPGTGVEAMRETPPRQTLGTIFIPFCRKA